MMSQLIYPSADVEICGWIKALRLLPNVARCWSAGPPILVETVKSKQNCCSLAILTHSIFCGLIWWFSVTFGVGLTKAWARPILSTQIIKVRISLPTEQSFWDYLTCPMSSAQQWRKVIKKQSFHTKSPGKCFDHTCIHNDVWSAPPPAPPSQHEGPRSAGSPCVCVGFLQVGQTKNGTRATKSRERLSGAAYSLWHRS